MHTNHSEVLANTGDGSEASNQKYLVPYIETEKPDVPGGEPYFYEYLHTMADLAAQCRFRKASKFYQEDKQESLSVLADILMAASDFDNLPYVTKYCDYLLAGGNNRKIYERMQMDYTYREEDSIVIDLHIKSTMEDRSFKKYKCSFERASAPTIPFDELLE